MGFESLASKEVLLINGLMSKMTVLATSLAPRRTPKYCLVARSLPPCPLPYEPVNNSHYFFEF